MLSAYHLARIVDIVGAGPCHISGLGGQSLNRENRSALHEEAKEERAQERAALMKSSAHDSGHHGVLQLPGPTETVATLPLAVVP